MKIGLTKKVGGYFARVDIIILILNKYYINISQRENHRRVLFGLSPRFCDGAHSFARRERFELSGLKAKGAHAASFQVYFEQKASGIPALATSLTCGGESTGVYGQGGAGRGGKKKCKVTKVDVAVKAEDSKITFSSSRSGSSRNLSSLSSPGSSSSDQRSSNIRNNSGSDRAVRAEHTNIGAHYLIPHIRVIRKCVIGVEGRGVSTRNTGQLSPLSLPSRPFRAHISRATAISLLLQYHTYNMEHDLRASRLLYHLSGCRCR